MKVKATDVGQTASASDVIFTALREAIVEGGLAEGELLRQDRIARMFNVSRIPVREALTRLEEQGLVKTQRYRGAVVSRLSIEEIRDIFEFRAILEQHIVRESVADISEETLALAESYCTKFATEPDSAQWGALNRKFHYTLYRDAKRPYFLQAVDGALDRVDRYLRAQLVLTDGMATARSEHAAILAACADRDADRAARLTRDHILNASLSLIAFLERQRAEEASAMQASAPR